MIWIRDHWLRSVNATSVLCRPQTELYFLFNILFLLSRCFVFLWIWCQGRKKLRTIFRLVWHSPQIFQRREFRSEHQSPDFPFSQFSWSPSTKSNILCSAQHVSHIYHTYQYYLFWNHIVESIIFLSKSQLYIPHLFLWTRAIPKIVNFVN